MKICLYRRFYSVIYIEILWFLSQGKQLWEGCKYLAKVNHHVLEVILPMGEATLNLSA